MTQDNYGNPFEIPELDPEVMMAVLTHTSVLSASRELRDGEHDAARFAEVGGMVLELSVSDTLFKKQPLLTAEELFQQRCQLLCDAHIQGWLDALDIGRKVIARPEAYRTLENPEELRHLFNALVGAVFTQRGMEVATGWINALIYPIINAPLLQSEDTSVLNTQ